MDDTSGKRPSSTLKRNIVSRTISTAKLSTRLGIGATKRLLNAKDMDPQKAIEMASALVNEFDGMKGLIMKFGQMASYLGTQMPPEARDILAQLQARSTALPFSEVRAVIESEFNRPIENLFEYFDENAFAAASIGQVHKARVKGREVAVKIQYPGIDNLIATDLTLVGGLFTLLMAGTSLPGKAMAQELRDRVLEECDYRREAHNQLKVRQLCEQLDDQHVPDVVLSHSTTRVLTTEFVSATDFQTFCKTADQDIKNKAGMTIFKHTMDSIFRHCYFNGDPQPGNYLFHPDGSVTFLDFGCIKQFDADFILRWKRMAKSILEQDQAENHLATDALGLIGNRKKFNHDFHWEMINHVYRPFRIDQPFRYDHQHNKTTNHYMLWENKNKFSSTMPKDFLFINRLQWGMAAIMADLQACNNYHPTFKAAIDAKPIPLFQR